ncbi:hypothetical protein LTR49_024907 [Elasticomyces elasticus]|nr:hypothetical protein LTR49_024907 [Elasticomyces elasticus]
MSATTTTNSTGIALNTLTASQAAHTSAPPNTSTQSTNNITVTATHPTQPASPSRNGSAISAGRQWSAVNDLVSTWVRRSLAAATFAIAIYYAQKTMRLAIWTAGHDHRGDCADDLSRGFTSPACEMTLARAALPPPVRERSEPYWTDAEWDELDPLNPLALAFRFFGFVGVLISIVIASRYQHAITNLSASSTAYLTKTMPQDVSPIADWAIKVCILALRYTALYLLCAISTGEAPRTTWTVILLVAQLYYACNPRPSPGFGPNRTLCWHEKEARCFGAPDLSFLLCSLGISTTNTLPLITPDWETLLG